MASLRERARTQGTPIIEDDKVTFVYEGFFDTLERPTLVGDLNSWGRRGEPIFLDEAEPDVWGVTLTIEPDAYLEYQFALCGNRMPDPLNPQSITNGMGGAHNYFYMPRAEQPLLTEPRPGIARGTVVDVTVENPYFLADGRRTVHLYRPPTSEPCPLLVVWDGQDYLDRAGLTAIVDNLIASGSMRPVAMALCDHANQARVVEYTCSEATLSFLQQDVLPLAREHLHLLDEEKQPGAHGILGASLGGLMALFAGMRMPRTFGRIISQSGAWGMTPDERFINDLVAHLPPRPLEIWMDVGRYEALLEPNRRMHEALAERAYDVTYREFAGGHNYTSWSVDVRRGLEELFPPAR